MKTILLGWELGAGFGYCLQLRQLADALAGAGQRPVLALRTLDYAHRLFADRTYPVLQAPWLIGRLTPQALADGFNPTGFADLMACNGFGSVDHLYSMLRGWRDLIDQLRPDLIVARYAPLLSLAAYGRLPAVVFGSAYSTPPADGPYFPQLLYDVAPYADQAQMLETVRDVQRRFGAPLPDALAEIYRGERRVVLGLPELDPYRGTRREPCAGMFEDAPPPHEIDADGFHAYLAGCGPTATLAVEALIESGLPGQIYARDSDPSLAARVAGSPIRWLDTPPDAIAAASGAALVVHHGGPGMAYAALAAGRPQVLLPQVLDQWLTACALDEYPHGLLLEDGITVPQVAERMARLAGDAVARRSAFDAACAIQAQGMHGAWRRVVEACQALLA